MSKWRTLLWPFVPIYGFAVGLRNKLFDWGYLASKSYDVPLVCIGNLSTGGTGKTPMVEFLLERLSQYKIGFVSRGYGRKTKGLRLISASDTAEDIGDEPWQIARKFPAIIGAVSEKRQLGIEELIRLHTLDLIVLDDAFQHRYVKPSCTLLLTTWDQPYFEDHLLPAGNLREGKSGARRAQILIVTKCPPHLSLIQKQSFEAKLQTNKVFFSSIGYGDLTNSAGDSLPQNIKKVQLLTGIAKPQPLIDEVSKRWEINQHWKFKDHHRFQPADIQALENSQLPIITTEKDWARLTNLLSLQLAERIFYWPIKTQILFNEEEKLMEELLLQCDLITS